MSPGETRIVGIPIVPLYAIAGPPVVGSITAASETFATPPELWTSAGFARSLDKLGVDGTPDDPEDPDDPPPAMPHAAKATVEQTNENARKYRNTMTTPSRQLSRCFYMSLSRNIPFPNEGARID